MRRESKDVVVTLRIVYAIVYSGYGLLFPFLALLLRSHQLSDPEISIALSTFGVAALLSPPLCGAALDRGLPFQRLFRTLVGLSALVAPLWAFAGNVYGASLVTLAFYVLFLPAVSLLDAHTVTLLKERQEPRSFQSIRVWGSAGFIAPTLVLAGIALVRPVTETLILFAVTAACLLSFIAGFFIPPLTSRPAAARSPTAAALQAAARPPLRSLFAGLTVTSLSLAAFFVLFPRFLQELGSSPVTVGGVVNLGVFFEILMIPISPLFVRRFGSRRVIALGAWALALRATLLYCVPTFPMVLVTQALHAPIVVGLMVAVPGYLDQHSSGELRYSLQSLFIALTLGLARIVGPLLLALFLARAAGGAALVALTNALAACALVAAVGGVFLSRERA